VVTAGVGLQIEPSVASVSLVPGISSPQSSVKRYEFRADRRVALSTVMASHESIRPEASTVHRAADVDAADVETPGRGDAPPPTDDQQLVQAKTVIRGSSRAGTENDHRDQVGRTPASVAKVLLGQHLNHFFLEELIGGGGMGAVFRARDEQLDRIVAIKVIPFAGDDPDLRRRFRNEAQSAAKLDHPRIARVFDVGSHDEWHYIVFEYIRGTNVRDLVIQGGVLAIDDAVFYTCQIAAAIQHASDRGIVHRDIKPSNVLIGDEDTIKLVDMGLARSENFELSEDMTASGVTLGTFDYISPEQARDPRDADLRSDIYSLGCTLYFMLTGRPPYPGGTMLQKLLSHGNSPPPDARELRSEVSDELMAVIEKMLAKSPEDRYQSATDLIADLREVAFRDDLTRTQAVGPVPVQDPNLVVDWFQRHAPWLVALGLLALVAGWLHLDAAASREDWSIPERYKPPQLVMKADQAGAENALSPPGEGTADAGGPSDGPTISPSPLGPPSALRQNDAEAAAEDRPRSSDLARQDDVAGGDDPAVTSDEVSRGDSARDATATSDTVGITQTPITIRVVAPDEDLDAQHPDQRVVLSSTLADAIDLAAQYDVDHIEISVPVLHSDPIVIRRDNLRINSTVAGGSTLVFQPHESLTMERTNVLSIGSNRIEIDDIHFVWKVPSGEVNGGALFAINDNPLVRLTDCSITVDNPAFCKAVYAFDVVTDPEQLAAGGAGFVSRDDSVLPLVAIELNSVIVRGQIGMIHMDYAAELQLNWDNGLLAISEPMIDSAGARVAPAPTARPIQLWLTRLTAHTPKGLLRMRVGVSGAYPVSVDRFARSSVFVVDVGVPHFEFRGLESLPSDSSLLQLSGTTNAYDTDPTLAEPVLMVWASQGESEMTRFNSLVSRWPDEVSPRWSVYWSEVRFSDAPMSRRTPADYSQRGSVRSGFDEKLLPILPD
jgi:hypothetical protein